MFTGTADHGSEEQPRAGARELVARCLGGAPFGSAAHGIAVLDGDVRLSYRELAARVQAAAAALVQEGVQPGWFVGVPTTRSAETVVAILASWAAGAAYCPIDPVDGPSRETAAVLDAVIVTPDAPTVHPRGVPTVLLPPRAGRADAEIVEDLGCGPGVDADPAYLMTTSGSSGEPKTTIVTRGGLRAVFEALYTALSQYLPEGARWTQLHPLTFGYSVCELLGSLVFGGRLVLVPREDPLTLAHLANEIDGDATPHVVCLTPSELAVLVARIRSGSGRLPSHIILSGEAAYRAPLAEVFALHGDTPPLVVNTYAATETSGQITAHVVTPETLPAVTDGYVGVPLPGVDVVLRQPDGQPVPRSDTATVGQIYVGGPTLATGYLDPVQTRQRFVATPGRTTVHYATGDLGQWSGPAGLRVVGRADRTAKLGGRWVGMEQIERLVAESDLVAEVAACTAGLGGREPDCLCLVVVPRADRQPNAGLVRDDVVRRLPLRVTVRLTTTDSIPRLSSGKIDVARVAELAAPRPSPVGRARDVARTVRAEWTMMLGAGVATDRNLFELGVDSLGIVAAAARLSAALDHPVSPQFLLSHARIDLQIARLSELIGRDGDRRERDTRAGALAEQSPDRHRM